MSAFYLYKKKKHPAKTKNDNSRWMTGWYVSEIRDFGGIEWKNPVCLFVVFPEKTFEQSLVYLERENKECWECCFIELASCCSSLICTVI